MFLGYWVRANVDKIVKADKKFDGQYLFLLLLATSVKNKRVN